MKGFQLGNNIPYPEQPALERFEMKGEEQVIYTLKSERYFPSRLKDNYTALQHPALAALQPSEHHFAYRWKHAHKTWRLARCSVYMDLGDDYLYELNERLQCIGPFYFIKRISKAEFITQRGGAPF